MATQDLKGRAALYAAPPESESAVRSVSLGRAWYAAVIMCALVAMCIVDRLILAVVAQPMSAELGLSDRALGLLMGIAFAIFYAAVGLPVSQMLDRGTRTRILGIGATVWGLASLASGFAQGFLWLAVCRGLLAVGEAVLTPAVVSLMPDFFPREKRALPMGLYFAIPVMAMSLTYVIGGAALDFGRGIQPVIGLSPWRTTLIVVALPSIALGLMMMLSVREPDRAEARSAEDQVSMRALFAFLRAHARFYAGFYTGMAAIGALWFGILSWLPTALVRGYDMSTSHAAYLLGVVGMPATLVGSYAWPALAVRLERNARPWARGGVLVVTSAGLVVGALGFLSKSPTVALTTFGLMSFFVSANSPTGSMVLQAVTPSRMLARAAALYLMLTSALGFSFGAYIVAALGENWFASMPHALLYAIVVTAMSLGTVATLGFAFALRPASSAVARELARDG